jgi:hypothetical protein
MTYVFKIFAYAVYAGIVVALFAGFVRFVESFTDYLINVYSEFVSKFTDFVVSDFAGLHESFLCLFYNLGLDIIANNFIILLQSAISTYLLGYFMLLIIKLKIFLYKILSTFVGQ